LQNSWAGFLSGDERASDYARRPVASIIAGLVRDVIRLCRSDPTLLKPFSVILTKVRTQSHEALPLVSWVLTFVRMTGGCGAVVHFNDR